MGLKQPNPESPTLPRFSSIFLQENLNRPVATLQGYTPHFQISRRVLPLTLACALRNQPKYQELPKG